MPVNSKHPEYAAMLPVWAMMRDVAQGQRAIHKAGEKYLPKFKGESKEDYAARVMRTPFFNATYRTIAGLKGMLFRVAPEITVSPAVKGMLEDITKTGVSIATFMQKIAEECLTVGRVGVMCDYPSAPTDGLTRARAEAMNLRPHLSMYRAESIINWDTAWVNNRTVTSRVVLEETQAIDDPSDEFKKTTRTVYRVLDLAPAPTLQDGQGPTTAAALAYRQRVMLHKETGDEVIEGPFFPMMNNRVMDTIPFQFFGVDTCTPNVEAPPLEDLANVNLSHYRTTADRKHGAHKTAMPQPWVTGLTPAVDKDGKPIKAEFYIGGGDLWTFPNKESTVGMLEYTGQGLSTLREELEREEVHMAVLGARMLEAQKKGVEAAETAGIHRSGESATLASQGATIASGMKVILDIFDEWGGGTGKTEVGINDEFFPASMTPEEITAQVQAWQAGALDKEELFNNLKTGGKIRQGTDYATHETKIANGSPTLLATAPTPTPAPAPAAV